MRAGIMRYGNADCPDAWIGLHAFKSHRSRGEFAQVSIAIDATQSVIGGRSIAFGTGLHGRTPMTLCY